MIFSCYSQQESRNGGFLVRSTLYRHCVLGSSVPSLGLPVTDAFPCS